MSDQAVSGSAGFSTASSEFLTANMAAVKRPHDVVETTEPTYWIASPALLTFPIAALVNVQSVEAVDGELKRRAVMGN